MDKGAYAHGSLPGMRELFAAVEQQDRDKKIAEIRRIMSDRHEFWTLSSGDHYNMIDSLLDEIDRLKEDLAYNKTMYDRVFDSRDKIEADRRKLIDGLRWYADAGNYTHKFYFGDDPSDPDELEKPIEADDGEKARVILKEIGVSL